MSFFYPMRSSAYEWGQLALSSGFREVNAQSLFSSIFSPLPAINTNTVPCVPLIPIGPSAAKLAILLANGSPLTIEIAPCDKQLPWKKIVLGYTRVGLTRAGELYLLAPSPILDASGGSLLRRNFEKQSVNDNYFSNTPRRIFLPDAPAAFKDVTSYTVIVGETLENSDFPAGAGSSNGSYGITAISKEGEVFVAGTCHLGEHGIPPSTAKPGCTLISASGRTQFWQSDLPPYFPVASRVSLPGGLKATSVPSGASGSVIAEDGQLYAWWRDPFTNEMHYPKRITGFVKRINVVNAGSQVLSFQQTIPPGILPGQNQDDLRMYSRLDFSEPPPGGKKPIALVSFNAVSLTMSSNVALLSPGVGYTSPPEVFVRGVNWKGQSPQFSCELFGDADGFVDTPNNGMGWMIGTDGCVYEYSCPCEWHAVPAVVNGSVRNVARALPRAPRRVTRPGRAFTHADANCFVDDSGSAFFVSSPYASGSAEDTQAPIQRTGTYEEVDLLDMSLNYAATAVYFTNTTNTPFLGHRIGEQWNLHKIGDGYAKATSNMPTASGFWKDTGSGTGTPLGKVFAGIKTDGSLWTAGNNLYGGLAETQDLTLTRKTPSHVCIGESWLSLSTANSDAVGGSFSMYRYLRGSPGVGGGYNRYAAIRKDAICREIDQPMEYYPDSYYKTLQ